MLPNFYFRVAMALAILQHNGVPVEKLDYLRPIDFLEDSQWRLIRLSGPRGLTGERSRGLPPQQNENARPAATGTAVAAGRPAEIATFQGRNRL
jgi:hypothetical protein